MTLNDADLPLRSATVAAQLDAPSSFPSSDIEGREPEGGPSAPTSRQTKDDSLTFREGRSGDQYTKHDSFRQGIVGDGPGGHVKHCRGFEGPGDGRAILDGLAERFESIGYRGWANILRACPATPRMLARMRESVGETWWNAAELASRGGVP